jgi:SAM-dependent methyltransferase
MFKNRLVYDYLGRMKDAPDPEWFNHWFDSPYYHALYKKRDESEAGFFIDNLVEHLKLPPGGRIVDIACGKGRHAIYLNKKGFDVMGLDIARDSIEFAGNSENETLHFALHDMRRPFVTNYFDAALNLFTSFGYFKTEHEHELAVRTMCLAVKKNGVVVIDFLNAQTVLRNIIELEEKKLEGISFLIKKQLKGQRLIKDIDFDAEGTHFHFEENVQMLRLKDFEKYFEHAGLRMVDIFGDYSLHPFRPEQSERLIMVGVKS